jgi:hypothetical protein
MIASLTLLAAIACGEQNPLLGNWKIDGAKSDSQALADGMGTIERIEFSETAMTMHLKPGFSPQGGRPNQSEVTYEVTGEHVDVTQKETGTRIRFFREEGGGLRWQMGPAAALYLQQQ